MGHIINLIAKAFIFGNKSETFEADIAIAENTNNLKAAISYPIYPSFIPKGSHVYGYCRVFP